MSNFVSYNQAVLIKLLDFKEPCFAKFSTKTREFRHNTLGSPTDYNSGSYGVTLVSAPLKIQIFNWGRTLGLNSVSPIKVNGVYQCRLIDENVNDDIDVPSGNSYNEAENKCLDILLISIKNKQNEAKNKNKDN